MSRTTSRGRQPAADLHIPPECDDMIRRGALVSISISGGKDSQAMTILLARTVPRDQLVVVHAPLGEVEWPDTIEHIQLCCAQHNSIYTEIEKRIGHTLSPSGVALPDLTGIPAVPAAGTPRFSDRLLAEESAGP